MLKILNNSFFLSILIIGFSSCVTTNKLKNDSFSFIQMSDPQFGFFNDNKSFEKETENFTKAITEANRLRPSFVVVTGDLVHKPFDSAQVREYRSIINKIDKSIPLYSVAGNHDVGNKPTIKNILDYNKEYGPDYYTFKNRSILGIVLNSLYLTAPDSIAQKAAEQEKWLVQVLDSSKKEKYNHIIVFLHHPFFLKDPNEKDEYFNIPISTRQRFLSIFKKYGVEYIFAGHYHRNSFGQGNGIQMITTGPVGKPLGKDPSGFRVVHINGKKLKHAYYDLNELPVNINLL